MNPDSSSLARRLVPTYDPNEEHRFSIHQAVFDELGAQHAMPNADYGRARRAYVKLRFKYNNNSKMIFLCQRVTLHILDNSLLDRTQHVVAIQSESEANLKKQIRRGQQAKWYSIFSFFYFLKIFCHLMFVIVFIFLSCGQKESKIIPTALCQEN